MNESETIIAEAEEAEATALAAMKGGFTEADVAARFRWLSQEVDATWLLLKRSGEIIGWCVAVWSGKNSHPEYPDIQDLYVRSEYRNQGFGSCLISEVERRAIKRGYTRLGIAVNPDDNPGARRLYERLGFRHDGRDRYLDGIYNGYEDWVIDLEREL